MPHPPRPLRLTGCIDGQRRGRTVRSPRAVGARGALERNIENTGEQDIEGVHLVVDDDQIGAAAGDAAAHADGAERAAADRFPLVLRADLAAAKASILRDAPVCEMTVSPVWISARRFRDPSPIKIRACTAMGFPCRGGMNNISLRISPSVTFCRWA